MQGFTRGFALAAVVAGAWTSVSAQAAPAEAVPPGFTMERTGSVHDFDYFKGGWNTAQHKRAADGSWEDFPGTLCMQQRLAGQSTIDELYFPQTRTAGLTVRLFDPKARQWSIFWASSVSGKLDPIPVVGGFDGDRGEFYAYDKVGGKPVKVRYLWLLKDHDHARWEQALSFDDKTWDTNWTADFTRGDTDALCEAGVPKR